MELVQGTRKSPKFAPEDVISSMPEEVITNIMDRLSIQDAVRTSILSTNWRFKWTLLSQLVFNEKFFEGLIGAEGTNNYKLRNVIGFLLHLKGSITKFVLRLPHHMLIDVEDINHWFLFLSGKGIKEVTLINWHTTPLKLPTHLFSCLELKHLTLHNCSFHPPPSFHGFPNLSSLLLTCIGFESYKCGVLITRCPLLESLHIVYCTLSDKEKPVEIVKLKNLSVLILLSSILDILPGTSSGIFQFVGFFPKLQVLHLDFQMCKFLAEAGARNCVPTSFPCLKTLHLYSIDFGNDVMVSYVFEIICCSPNLQTLRILEGSFNDDVPPSAPSSDLAPNTMGQLQLRSVMFASFRGSKNEVCLIKSLLACSTLLKKMVIELDSSFGGDGIKFDLAKKLLNLPRASPVAEIDIVEF